MEKRCEGCADSLNKVSVAPSSPILWELKTETEPMKFLVSLASVESLGGMYYNSFDLKGRNNLKPMCTIIVILMMDGSFFPAEFNFERAANLGLYLWK